MLKLLLPTALAVAAILAATPPTGAKSAAQNPAKLAKAGATPIKASVKARNIVVTVDGSGYHPSVVGVRAGVPVRMVFVSKGSGCSNSVVIPALKQKFRLRMGQQKAIAFTPRKGQSIAFACSMDMFHGKVFAK